jgi:hypothetical protein
MRVVVRVGLVVCLCLVTASALVQPREAVAAVDYPLDVSDAAIDDAVEYLLDQQGSDGGIAGFAVSAWAVMALAAAGETSAVADLMSYLEDEASTGSFQATDWARMILAIVAAGEDPTDFGGEDYIGGLQDLYEVEDVTGEDYTQIGDPDLLNDDIWGILALVAAEESVNQDIVDFVQEMQGDDGGWGIDVYGDSDVDVTAAAIMALKAIGLSSGSTTIANGLAFLHAVQNSDGGFPSQAGGQSNAASDAWAILAIVAAGGDPDGSTWEQDGETPVDHLLSLQDSDGWFEYTSGDSVNPLWMTAYAIPALLGEPYPVPALPASGGDAAIGRFPTTLAFRATEGGDGPLARTFHVWNDGDGTMQYTVTDNKTWLYVSPSSGNSSGERDTITVEVDTDGMDAGEHQGTITITSSGASNSPRTVAVTLSVDVPTSDAEIAFWSEELVFTAIEGGSDPANQFIEIWNPGPGSLEWEVDVDDDWLNVSPSSGTSSGEHDKVTVSIDIDGLDTGDYEATITITSDDADNSPQTVTVTLDVTDGTSNDEPDIAYSPSTLTFDAIEDDDDPDAKTFQVWNSGDGRLDWVVSADADWLSVSPTSGTSNGEKDTVSVSSDISGLAKGTYTARITIQDDDDASNRETLRVTLVIQEAEPEEQATEMYILVATTTPEGAGTITRSVTASGSSYPPGTTITLTATPSPGYAFVGWAGEAGGSAPTTTVVMSNHRSVVARFLRFDASGLTNVKLAYVPPDLSALTVMPYPVESIPSNPPGFRIDSAYVIQPEGSGTFALEFSELTNADSVALFQVVNGNWTQVPRTVMSDTSLQVTLPVADTVLTLASPGSSSSDLWQKVTGFFGSMDSTTIIIMAVIAALALVVIAIIALLLRRDSY